MTGPPLSRSERANLVLRILESLFLRPWSDIDAILTAFGLQGVVFDEASTPAAVQEECRASLRSADDATLWELGRHLLGPTDPSITDPSLETERADDLWGVGSVRVFLSHLASERSFIGEVGTELKHIGISSFVAHDSIDVSKEWQDEIERALRTADVLVGIAHPGFHESPWTQQEIGWALGRGIPVSIIGIDETPRGFPARFQARIMTGRTASGWRIATSISAWLTLFEEWREDVIDGLIHDLQTARSYFDAKQAALRLKEADHLTAPLLDAIEIAYRSNDQLHPYHVGAVVVEQILNAHGRALPRDAGFLGSTGGAEKRGT